MDQILIDNWNSIVTKRDTIYHLGDVGFTQEDKLYNILKKLNGKIHLILGNHDKIIRKSNLLKSRFESISDIKNVYVNIKKSNDIQQIVLCHYAMRVWDKSHFGSYHLYGHSHGTLQDDQNSLSLDVGVDNWNYYPVSFEQIHEKMNTKNFKPLQNVQNK
jgi:calcineurin-like phosphoesterase family protein